MKTLALLLVLLASVAEAQTVKAPWRTADVALCLPVYNPPADVIRIYCDSPSWGTVPGYPWDLPGFFPKGGVRTGIWLGCPADGVVTVTAIRAGKETARSTIARSNPAGMVSPDCSKYSVASPPMKMSDWKSPSDRLSDLMGECFGDLACGALVLENCLKTPACRETITSKLTKVDFDQDGVPNTWRDQLRWELTLQGKIK